ncbi:MAG: sigma-70 family RNA polymerase sigma factor [Acidobacteria bacterium]|nr:sigma-70 family RNA polymerase sigma factor [Acidobacteriota bacterium]
MSLTPEVRQLIEKTRRGDVKAFQSLYERYVRKVLNFCYRLTGSRDMAEEVAQETFVSVFKNIAKLEKTSRFEPWLFMIARNYVYQAFRKNKLKTVSADQTDEDNRSLVHLESGRSTPEEQFLKEELKDVVFAIIQSLDLKYREVFVLAVLEGYSYDEVAKMVGRKVQSVKTDIHRARVKIREKLAAYLEKGKLDDAL